MKMHTVWGKTGTLKDLVNDPRCVVKYHTAANRINKHHWGIEKALTTQVRTKRQDKEIELNYSEVMAVTKMKWL